MRKNRNRLPMVARSGAIAPWGCELYPVALGIVGLLLLSASLAQPARLADDITWRVVVLNNADFLLPASALMDQSLRETVTREAPHSVEFFGEALDSFRHPHDIDAELHTLLQKKYSGVKVDLVMARSQGAIDFLRRYRDELWPKVPVVFYNELSESLRENGQPPDSTGVLIDLDPADTISLALRLHPQAHAIYVIGGSSEYDRNWRRRLQPMLGRLPARYVVTWLDNLPLPQLLDAVRNVPADSVVLYTSVMVDAEGKTRVNPQVIGAVAAASVAPVYGFFDTYLGSGIVGGAITDFAGQGRTAGRLALRVLGGEPAAGIPVQPSPPAHCVVDARVLQRFGIDEDLLPAGCDVRYRSPSVWRDYRWYILAALAALAFQSLLIATLLVQRGRRRKAELAAHQQRLELAHALRLATVGEMTAAISHEINQPLGAILSNADAAEMLLESDVPSVSNLREILADIRRDDLRASDVVRRIRALLQKHDTEWEPFDLEELVLEAVHLVGAEAARRGTTVEVQSTASPLTILGDRVQLQQLVLNLLLNAMDAMAQTPVELRRVTLRASRSLGGKVELAVSDAGHGIAAGTSERLFDSFFTTKPKGLGLGLSIARTIAEAHGGGIQAENNPSVGATFRVTLPEARAESIAARGANGQASSAGAR